VSASFENYAEAGYLGELIPILPPDAKMSEKSAVSPKQRGKIPGIYHPNRGVWTGFPDWSTATFTMDDVRKWDRWPKANKGLRTRIYQAVDIDTEVPMATDAIRDAAFGFFGRTLIRGRKGSLRILLPYRMRVGDAPMPKLRVTWTHPLAPDEGSACEFLGNGQQFVCEGIHPSGNPYTWAGGVEPHVFGPDPLPPITAEMRNAFVKHIVEHVLPGLGCTDIEWGAHGTDTTATEFVVGDPALAGDRGLLAEAVNRIPVAELDYEQWITLTHAIKMGCGGEELFYETVFEPWSLKWPGSTPEYIRAKWDSVTGATIGAQYVLDHARAYGFVDTSGFEEVTSADVAPPTDEPLHPMLEGMNRRYFVAQDGARVAVCELRHDPELNRQVLIRQQPKDFLTLWQNCRLPDAKDNIGKTWLRHPRRRTYNAIVFMPGQQEPAGTFNLWRGFAVEAKSGDCSLFKKFVLDVICDGDRIRFEYLWCWMARTVQYPAEPGMVAPVLRGRQRIGKGFFVNQFGRIWGPHFMAVSNGLHLVGKHNAHLENVCVLFCDEALFAGDRSIVGPLKSLITEKTITIEPKFFDARQAPNRLKVIMASNEDHVVPTDRSGEARRFFVLDVNDAHARDKAYFGAISKEMDEGGVAALLYELQQTDLSQFDVERVPVTEALIDQKVKSLEDVAQYWLEALHRGELPVPEAGAEFLENEEARWISGATVQINHLYDDYVRWAQTHRVHNPKVEQEFGKWLRRLLKGEDLEVTRPTGAPARPRCYVLPPLERCRAAFERFLDAPIAWTRFAD